jgi:hypothetical protein
MDVVWHDAARTEYLWRHLGDWWKSNCLGRPDPLGDTCPLGKLIEKRPTRSVSNSRARSIAARHRLLQPERFASMVVPDQ